MLFNVIECLEAGYQREDTGRQVGRIATNHYHLVLSELYPPFCNMILKLILERMFSSLLHQFKSCRISCTDSNSFRNIKVTY